MEDYGYGMEAKAVGQGEMRLPRLSVDSNASMASLHQSPKPGQHGNARRQQRANNKPRQKSGKQTTGNVFAEFLRSVDTDREDRLRNISAGEEDDARRRLAHNHRSSKMQLLHSADSDLRDVRYSSIGHDMFMRKLGAMNNSRSDPCLMKEASKIKKSPEVLEVRKLSKQLHSSETKVVLQVQPPKAESLSPKFHLGDALAGLGSEDARSPGNHLAWDGNDLRAYFGKVAHPDGPPAGW